MGPETSRSNGKAYHLPILKVLAIPLTFEIQVLQQHCEYFDRDRDGIIWPLDTWRCFREWAFFWPLAAFGTFIIHFALSYPSGKTLLPDPFFRIHIDNVHKNKHGSDSMTFDSEGRFRPQHFEDFFAKYDKDGKGGLSKWEVLNGLRGQLFAFDFFGCSAATLECECRRESLHGLIKHRD